MDFFGVEDKEKWKDGPYPSGMEGNILQSWNYGNFLQRVGRKLVRIQAQEGSKFYQCQYIVQKTLIGLISFAYVPRMYVPNSEVLDTLLLYFRKQNYVFARIETTQPDAVSSKFVYKEVLNRQIPHTLILDITHHEEDLLNSFHEKTRYNIKLADRKGVTIEEKKDLDIYWNLNQETVDRDHFYTHPRTFFKELLDSDLSHQFIAYHAHTPIASIITVRDKNTLYYFFGASADTYRNVMAPYLLQWYAIRYGKQIGCTQYDMWGSAPFVLEKSPHAECRNSLCWSRKSPLTGVTRFKSGFGGKPYTYPPAREYILNPVLYSVYSLYTHYIHRGHVIGHPHSSS